MTGDFKNKLEEICETTLKNLGLELFDLIIKKTKRKTDIEVIIDKIDDYVSIEDCEKASREIEPKIEEIDNFLSNYNLIVSSPGITRSLRKFDDFTRFKGNLCKIITSEPVEKQSSFLGYIENTDENLIILKLKENKKLISLNYDIIKNANLEVDI